MFHQDGSPPSVATPILTGTGTALCTKHDSPNTSCTCPAEETQSAVIALNQTSNTHMDAAITFPTLKVIAPGDLIEFTGPITDSPKETFEIAPSHVIIHPNFNRILETGPEYEMDDTPTPTHSRHLHPVLT